jgi:hypothetical protein
MLDANVARPQYSLSIEGLLGASLTIVVTTLEDCVWLIPFVAHASREGSTRIAWIHAGIFVCTFTACSVFACILALVLSSAIVGAVSNSEVVLETVGATLCWIFSGYFFIKSCRTSQKRGAATSLQDDNSPECSTRQDNSEGLLPAGEAYSSYGAAEQQRLEGAETVPSLEPTTDPTPLASPVAQPWMIASLTIIGSLDEISYFPAVIVGQIFTSAELIAGTVIASLLILALVEFLQRHCLCVLEVLDRIPLYAIIGLFAILLTIEAVVGAIQD